MLEGVGRLFSFHGFNFKWLINWVQVKRLRTCLKSHSEMLNAIFETEL